MVAALLVGCGRPDCVSPNGVNVFNAECAAYEASEAKAADAFAANVGWNRDFLSRRLDGWTVEVVDGDFEADGDIVSGIADCNWRHVRVAAAKWEYGILAHELAHAAEDCVDPNHLSWDRRGITKAIAIAAKVRPAENRR
jgi:hypothetical protein